MDRWLIYIRERFPLGTMSLLVAGICLSGLYVYGRNFQLIPFVLSFVGVLLFFALLRLMDEVKDFEKDRIAHRERPLPRGLIAKGEAVQIIELGRYILLAYALIIWVFLQSTAALVYVFLILYLWMMYKEFGMGQWLQKRPITYAITHQLSGFLIAIFAVSVATPGKALAPATWAFGLVLVGAFFCYEICRKLDPHAHPILATYMHFYGFKKTFELAVIMLVLSAIGSVGLGLEWLLIPCEVVVLLTLCLLFYQSAWFRIPEFAASISLLIHVWAVFLHKVMGMS